MGKEKGTGDTGEDLISGTFGDKAGLQGWLRDRECLMPEKRNFVPDVTDNCIN